MNRTVPSSAAGGYAKVYATPATDASFPSRPDTATRPSGDGVIDLAGAGGSTTVPTFVRLAFFAAGSDGDQFGVRVYGVAASGTVWASTPLFEGTLTLGTRTGAAGGLVGAADLYADTLVAAAVPYGVADNSFRAVSPADNTVARLLLDTEGFGFLRVDFKRVSGTPSMNAMYADV